MLWIKPHQSELSTHKATRKIQQDVGRTEIETMFMLKKINTACISHNNTSHPLCWGAYPTLLYFICVSTPSWPFLSANILCLCLMHRRCYTMPYLSLMCSPSGSSGLCRSSQPFAWLQMLLSLKHPRSSPGRQGCTLVASFLHRDQAMPSSTGAGVFGWPETFYFILPSLYLSAFRISYSLGSDEVKLELQRGPF